MDLMLPERGSAFLDATNQSEWMALAGQVNDAH
jgi:hypothetical protein